MAIVGWSAINIVPGAYLPHPVTIYDEWVSPHNDTTHLEILHHASCHLVLDTFLYLFIAYLLSLSQDLFIYPLTCDKEFEIKFEETSFILMYLYMFSGLFQNKSFGMFQPTHLLWFYQNWKTISPCIVAIHVALRWQNIFNDILNHAIGQST